MVAIAAVGGGGGGGGGVEMKLWLFERLDVIG